MATHSNILAWRIPWTEEPGGLQSMVLQRVIFFFFFLESKSRSDFYMIFQELNPF